MLDQCAAFMMKRLNYYQYVILSWPAILRLVKPNHVNMIQIRNHIFSYNIYMLNPFTYEFIRVI